MSEEIKHLAELATDFMATCQKDSIADLNRRLGYCEAVLDLILYEPDAVTDKPEKTLKEQLRDLSED